MSAAVNPQQRFSGRVEFYRLYRPGYPELLFQFMENELGLKETSIVAEAGSGTGIFAENLLKRGVTVYCIEPNLEMRTLSEQTLGSYEGFRSAGSSAESTTMQSGSCDFVVAAQAFHWFERSAVKKEFARILKPGGWCLLIWNDRKDPAFGFLRDYESFLLKYGIDYEKVNHKNIDSAQLEEFFAPNKMQSRVFDNHQAFDFEGLVGRVLSCSYMPDERHPIYPEMIAALKELFDRYNVNGTVRLEYDTRVHYSQF